MAFNLENTEYLEIKNMKITSKGVSQGLDDFLINFIIQNKLGDEEQLVEKNVFCEKNEFENYDNYTFIFLNKPEVEITVYYGEELPESLTVWSLDTVYHEVNIYHYHDTEITYKQAFITISTQEAYYRKQFNNGLRLIKEQLDTLLMKEDLSFMDELIIKAKLNPKKAYRKIANACEYFIKHNY